jgi:putative nucleotidyltransferase with HDIG domain
VSFTNIPTWSIYVAKTIMEAVRVKDVETYAHCIRVSQGSRILAKAAGLNEFDQKVAEFAGLFHDVGKIGIPENIILKPGKLTDGEYEIMKSHPDKSVQILEPLVHLDFFAALIPGVKHHHERFDGRGYPDGVMGEDIPLTARLVLIADTFDAMTADRAYRKGLSADVAYQELQDHAGRQFDPRLVKIFLEAHPLTTPAELKKMFGETINDVVPAFKVAA